MLVENRQEETISSSARMIYGNDEVHAPAERIEGFQNGSGIPVGGFSTHSMAAKFLRIANPVRWLFSG